MGVYIKNMEMPNSEEKCKFFQPAPFRAPFCPINGVCHGIDDCPLVPVPPHGRLIDADALYEVVKKRTRNWAGGWSDIECVLTGNDIKNAPTIFDAEGGEA